MGYGGLQLSPDTRDTKVTLVPSESDKRDGKGWKKVAGTWEQRAKVLRNFQDARDFLGNDANRGIAAQTLGWREEAKRADEEEDARLLYVALTRAEDFLMLSCLVRPASGDDRKAGHAVSPVMTDRVISGIDAANEAYADDGKSTEDLLHAGTPCLPIGDKMTMRFGRDAFGTCCVSKDAGQPASTRRRPDRIALYEDDTMTSTTVTFVMTTERNDE
jgi:hypothetical protein